MVTKIAIKKRRDRVLRAIGKGLKTYEIAEKEGINIRTVDNDIKAIKEEITKRLKNEDLSEFLLELYAITEDNIRSLNALYGSTKHDNIKLGAKKQIVQLLETKIDLLQRLGLLNKAPLKVEVTASDIVVKELEALDERGRELHKQQEDSIKKNAEPSRS